MVKKATKEVRNQKLTKAARSTTKKVAVTKPLAKKPRTLLAKAMTDDGFTL